MTALMDSLRTYWMVHALLALYTVMLAIHAWEGNRSTKGIADYYVGGRSMGGVVIGLSFFATYSSTNSFVGFAGQAYDWGIAWLLLTPAILAFMLLAWLVVAPRLRDYTGRVGSLTLPDFIGFRYASTPARMAAAVIVLFASFFYMTAVFKGIGDLIRTYLEIPYRTSIAIVFVVVMGYTIIGGFISVVKTDAVQGVIMVGAALLLFYGTWSAAGGLAGVEALRAATETEHLFRWNGAVAFPVVLGVIFSGAVKFVVEPRQLSRFYALEGRSAIRVGVTVCALVFALAYGVLVPIGILARRILPGGLPDTDLVVPTLLASPEVFAPGAAAFLVVAMVAAAMSSLDSVLLVMASTAERDLASVLRGRELDEAGELRATRIYVALFALVTAVIALNPPGGVVALTAFSGALYGACFGPAVLLGLYWKRGNGTAVLASFASGISALIVWGALPVGDVLHEVFPAVALSFFVYWLVASLTEPEGDAAIRPDAVQLQEVAS